MRRSPDRAVPIRSGPKIQTETLPDFVPPSQSPRLVIVSAVDGTRNASRSGFPPAGSRGAAGYYKADRAGLDEGPRRLRHALPADQRETLRRLPACLD